ncbi:MAG: DNA mismatch endonuclease Vsr [Thermoplasmata archaeon]
MPERAHDHDLRWGPLLRTVIEFYQEGEWRVPVLRERGADPFLVLVSTILSHRTRDEVTERATVRLLSEYATPLELSRAPLSRVRHLVREVGLWDSKAKGLRSAAKTIVRDFGGQLPVAERDLLRIPMVGPKTAHAIRVFGHQRPGIPVDTHILRVMRRLGAIRSTTIRGAQKEISTKVPRRYWALLNPVLVQHGQNLCRAHLPLCEMCPVSARCPKIGVPRTSASRTVMDRDRMAPVLMNPRGPTSETSRQYLRDGRAPIPEYEVTSRVMSANRGRNTSPELALRGALRRLGRPGYRLHASGIPGRPDVAFLSEKVAVFVHGCYWHRCPRCQMPLPRSHTGFWAAKFEANQRRDKQKETLLALAGWKLVTLWECEIKEDASEAATRVLLVLGTPKGDGERPPGEASTALSSLESAR